MQCAMCPTPLTGRQTRYCSPKCRHNGLNQARQNDGRRAAYDSRPEVRQHHRTKAAELRRARDAQRTCAHCGEPGVRSDAKYCDRQCASLARLESPRPKTQPTPRTCLIPATHPARWYGQASPITYRNCGWCDALFALHTDWLKAYCTPRCRQRAKTERRRGRIAGDGGYWRWSDFMCIAARFDYRCAYCHDKPDSLDPDHVVPISRGGYNTLTNLLPSCRPCNSSKSDLLLHEWTEARRRRGQPPRTTTWPTEDRRVWHLTQHNTLAA